STGNLRPRRRPAGLRLRALKLAPYPRRLGIALGDVIAEGSDLSRTSSGPSGCSASPYRPNRRRRPGRRSPPPDKPSIAVLPFQNMSGDPEQECFAAGIVEDIISALSRIRAFFVIARNSGFTCKGKAFDVKHVGRELGVRYVLEGSVRKASGGITGPADRRR